MWVPFRSHSQVAQSQQTRFMHVPFRVPITTTCQYPVPCRGAPCGCPSAPIRKSPNLSKRASCTCPSAYQSQPPAHIRSPVGAPLVGALRGTFWRPDLDAIALEPTSIRSRAAADVRHFRFGGKMAGRIGAPDPWAIASNWDKTSRHDLIRAQLRQKRREQCKSQCAVAHS